MNTCISCGRAYVYMTGNGRSKTLCQSCHVMKRRASVKRRLIDAKGGRCERCGYDEHIGALGFHHRDPAAKSFKIAGNENRAWAALVAEVAKCALLCANCHIVTHSKMGA